MLTEAAAGEVPVHFPADPDKFAFDAEVSKVFHNMAERSIPNFRAAHHAHARMISRWIQPGASILDIGASRGAFFRALKMTHPVLFNGGALKLTAIDNSPHMCEYLRQDYREANVYCLDITCPEFMNSKEQYDVVCVNYVLQFIPPEHQTSVMLAIFSKVKPGGVLLWGHKSKHYGYSGDAAHEEYIRFRVENGYTREEIEAKTKALRASMFPIDHNKFLRTLNLHFAEVTETFRFMMFSTLLAVK